MLSPHDTFTVYLDGLPPEDKTPARPAIVCRFATAGFWRRYAASLDEVYQLAGPDYITGLVELVSTAVHRMANVPDDDLAELLPTRELRLLAATLPTHADVGVADLGNSESPSASPAAEYAETATPEKAPEAA